MNIKYYIKVENNGKVIHKYLYDDHGKALDKLKELISVAKSGLIAFSDLEFETIEEA